MKPTRQAAKIFNSVLERYLDRKEMQKFPEVQDKVNNIATGVVHVVSEELNDQNFYCRK